MQNRIIINKEIAQTVQETFKQHLLKRASYDKSLPPNLERLAVVYERNIRLRCSTFEVYEQEYLDFITAIQTDKPLKAVVTLNFNDGSLLMEEERAQVRQQMREVIEYNSGAALNNFPIAILDDLIKKKEAQAFDIYWRGSQDAEKYQRAKYNYICNIEKFAWAVLTYESSEKNTATQFAMINVHYPSSKGMAQFDSLMDTFKMTTSSSSTLIARVLAIDPSNAKLVELAQPPTPGGTDIATVETPSLKEQQYPQLIAQTPVEDSSYVEFRFG